MIICQKCGKANKNGMTQCVRCHAALVDDEHPPMTYHKALRFIKIFIAMTAITSLYASFANEFSIYRTVDQIFYVIEFVFIAISFFYHEKRIGVNFLFFWAYAELGLYYVTLIIAAINNMMTADLTEQLISYTIGTVVIALPTYIYYKKRYKLLT